MTAAVLAVALLCCCTAAAGGVLELVLVQVIHRHGARSPLTPANASIVCPRGCGLLNYQGKDMLLKQGEYLRGRYNGSRPDVYNNATPFFATELYPDGTTYDVRQTYSRSTDLTRTLQSATGLLKGLFPNETEYFPAVSTVQFLQDELLLIDVSPSYHIYQQLDQGALTSQLKAYVNTVFPDPTVIDAMSVENNIEGYCSKGGSWIFVNCVLTLQDIAAARNAEGRLASLPVTQQYFEQLNSVRETWNSYYFPYNASNAVNAARGSLGQNIVQRMFQNMFAAIASSAKGAPTPDLADFPYKLMHYSAHDTTVMPFCATLGNSGYMLPPFGQLYLLELLRDVSDGSFHVRAAQSVPGQTPESHHAVTESVFPLHCVSENGTLYTVASITGTCPLYDFQRYVNSSLPLSPAGTCYLSPDALAAIDCDVVGGSGPLPNSTCYFYRSYCPAVACPNETVLSPLSYACVALSTTSVGGSVSSGIVVAAVIGSAFAAFFAALFGAKVWGRRKAAKAGRYTAVSS
jgi:hypothetical protein